MALHVVSGQGAPLQAYTPTWSVYNSYAPRSKGIPRGTALFHASAGYMGDGSGGGGRPFAGEALRAPSYFSINTRHPLARLMEREVKIWGEISHTASARDALASIAKGWPWARLYEYETLRHVSADQILYGPGGTQEFNLRFTMNQDVGFQRAYELSPSYVVLMKARGELSWIEPQTEGEAPPRFALTVPNVNAVAPALASVEAHAESYKALRQCAGRPWGMTGPQQTVAAIAATHQAFVVSFTGRTRDLVVYLYDTDPASKKHEFVPPVEIRSAPKAGTEGAYVVERIAADHALVGVVHIANGAKTDVLAYYDRQRGHTSDGVVRFVVLAAAVVADDDETRGRAFAALDQVIASRLQHFIEHPLPPPPGRRGIDLPFSLVHTYRSAMPLTHGLIDAHQLFLRVLPDWANFSPTRQLELTMAQTPGAFAAAAAALRNVHLVERSGEDVLGNGALLEALGGRICASSWSDEPAVRKLQRALSAVATTPGDLPRTWQTLDDALGAHPAMAYQVLCEFLSDETTRMSFPFALRPLNALAQDFRRVLSTMGAPGSALEASARETIAATSATPLPIEVVDNYEARAHLVGLGVGRKWFDGAITAMLFPDDDDDDDDDSDLGRAKLKEARRIRLDLLAVMATAAKRIGTHDAALQAVAAEGSKNSDGALASAVRLIRFVERYPRLFMEALSALISGGSYPSLAPVLRTYRDHLEETLAARRPLLAKAAPLMCSHEGCANVATGCCTGCGQAFCSSACFSANAVTTL